MSEDILIGSKLKILREFRNLTQAEVAGKLHISPTAYARLEQNNAKLGIDQAQILAEVLQVSLTDLISNDSPIISFVNKENGVIHKGYIHNNYEQKNDDENRLLAAKDSEIISLKEQIKYLQEQVTNLTSLLGNRLNPQK